MESKITFWSGTRKIGTVVYKDGKAIMSSNPSLIIPDSNKGWGCVETETPKVNK